MKRIAAIFVLSICLLYGFAATSASAGTGWSCHWTRHWQGNVSYHVQTCTTKRHVQKHHASKWNHAGPGNSVKPRIG